MESFAPEFAQLWLAGHGRGDDTVRERFDDDAGNRAQLEALEELAERVSAARSVI